MHPVEHSAGAVRDRAAER